LFARFASRQDDSTAMKVVAALRTQFGGHSSQAVDRRPAESVMSEDGEVKPG
jgi:6-phosphogluconate dehydrogenase